MNENEKVVELVEDNETDELKQAVTETLERVRTQAMLLGAQTMCSVILEKIVTALNKPGKVSLNDYKRLTKDIEQFCRTGLSRKVNLDGTTTPMDDNTKLVEDAE